MRYTFAEYEEFIYLNTTLDRNEARNYARECWNKGLSKTSAVMIFRTRTKEDKV